MEASRELKICRNSDKKQSSAYSKEENSFEFSLSRNNKRIKTQLKSPKIIPLEIQVKKCDKNTIDLNLSRNNETLELPQLKLPTTEKSCNNPKVLMYDKLDKPSTNDNTTTYTKKPTIPAAQVQADWEETDTTNPAYIKNKPSVYTKVEVDALVGGGGTGYSVTYDNGNVIFSGSTQPTYNNGNIIFLT